MWIQISNAIPKEIILDRNDIEIKTIANNLESVLWILKYHSLLRFDQILDITAIDCPGSPNRFKVIYILRSLPYNSVISTSFTSMEVNTNINSMNYLFNNSSWLEREVWDMFGIRFHNNNELRRVLTDYGFNVHPLRKDVPLTGFKEIYYDDSSKRILYEPVEMAQELRVFTFQYRPLSVP